MSDQKPTDQLTPSLPPSSGAEALRQYAGVLNAPGPQIPDQATIDSFGAVLGPEELKKRQEELNKEK
ncbi:hypothetical protein RhiJN_20900 [Ceratobasidium sp. AG-Ba]|nr:hypothetical protein RhiJN_20900 [Ceratobasidium sp. AG-Ba]